MSAEQTAKLKDSAGEYLSELESKSMEEIQSLFDRAKSAEQERKLQEDHAKKDARLKEIEQFLARPGVRPRYEYWSKMSKWTKDEAILLTANLEPGVMDMSEMPGYILDFIIDSISETKELVSRAVAAYDLHNTV